MEEDPSRMGDGSAVVTPEITPQLTPETSPNVSPLTSPNVSPLTSPHLSPNQSLQQDATEAVQDPPYVKRGPISLREQLLLARKMGRRRKLSLSPMAPIEEAVPDPYLKAQRSINKVRGRTALISNFQESSLHDCLWDKEYPECPRRLSEIFSKLIQLKLPERCLVIPTRRATIEEIMTCHSQDMYSLLENVSVDEIPSGTYETLSSRFDAIFINKFTFDAAATATGCCIELIDAILTEQAQNGMALIRPPGHHAMYNEFNGYCLFNNAAIAAKYALKNYGLSRIMIVDIDVHHGQGVQQCFIESRQVLYVSIHRYENGDFWPNLKQGDFNYVGSGEGYGYNFNIPLNETGMTDVDYLTIFHRVILPIAHEGEMLVTSSCYGQITKMLHAFAGGKLAVFLEGGYCTLSLSEGVAMTIKALLDDPIPRIPLTKPPKASLLESITNCIAHHKDIWRCFQYCPGPDPEPINQIPIPNQPGEVGQYPTRDAYPSPVEITAPMRELIMSPGESALCHTISKLALFYDPIMLIHEHRDKNFMLENPQRLIQTIDLLKSSRVANRCVLLDGHQVDEDKLLRVHPQEYLTELKQVIENQDDTYFTSVYTNDQTYYVASTAAGTAVAALQQVMEEKARAALCLIRPPGHHAEPSNTSGFCIFNNVAIVAESAIADHNLQRVLIVDFDVHHPNGTYEKFMNSPQVLLISIHRYGNNFFPKTGSIDEIGIDEGEGFNVNIPWNQTGQNDGEYLGAFLQVVLPIATAFDPEVVLVSAGFDAGVGDPLGKCCVTPEMFGHMTNMLKNLAGGKLIMLLEGGYNVTTVSHGVMMCAKALLGDPLPPITSPWVQNEASQIIIDSVINKHADKWAGLKLPTFKVKEKIKVTQVPKITRTVSHKPLVRHQPKPVAKEISKLVAKEISHYPTVQDLYRRDTVPPNNPPIRRVSDCKEPSGVICVMTTCPHIEHHLEEFPDDLSLLNLKKPCFNCEELTDRWFCLTCFEIGCSKRVRGHAAQHAFGAGHPLVMHLVDLKVWCYSCGLVVESDLFTVTKNIVFHQITGKTREESSEFP